MSGTTEPLNLYFLERSKSGSSSSSAGGGTFGSGGDGLEMTTRGGAEPQDGYAAQEDEGFNPLDRIASVGRWFGSMLNLTSSGTRNPYSTISSAPTNSKPRKVPVKVEPKVFFANERTFLAWLHMSVTLASISVAIVAFAEANKWSQLYGLLLMPCAIAFCIYSLHKYISRAGMIRRKDPGPYEDLLGPIVLSGMLAMSIIVNFFVKMYDFSTQ